MLQLVDIETANCLSKQLNVSGNVRAEVITKGREDMAAAVKEVESAVAATARERKEEGRRFIGGGVKQFEWNLNGADI